MEQRSERVEVSLVRQGWRGALRALLLRALLMSALLMSACASSGAPVDTELVLEGSAEGDEGEPREGAGDEVEGAPEGQERAPDAPCSAGPLLSPRWSRADWRSLSRPVRT